ncbi:target of EGR1 protein 1-like [Corticium candelabrum]|uniref:target of EGR1 protein 1-like n=1 Tax=Corticium candelabrum TaxID=121492 RepID=UPI002E264444|nr:target of EGR1 protein 1-like [Corticium candelabrum]
MWPTIELSIQSSDIVALDMELSGLGDRQKLQLQNIEERYKSICEVCRSRGVVSLGLATFHLSSTRCYNVAVYNLMLLSEREYMVEPCSLQFLLDHGFDFNKQYRDGIRYAPFSDDYIQSSRSSCFASVESLFSSLIRSCKPVVFHNGLIDLAFLYQHFYAPLPLKLNTFLSDLSDIFPSGIFDTKYVAEFCTRDEASYLHYIFRKRQRRNIMLRLKGEKHIELMFDAGTSDTEFVDWVCCAQSSMGVDAAAVTVCHQYANHGYCRASSSCPASHDIDIILDQQEASKQSKEAKKRRRRRKRKHTASEENENSTQVEVSTETDAQSLHSNEPTRTHSDNKERNHAKRESPQTGGHRAGFDAFMAGFCLVFMAEMESDGKLTSWKEGLLEWRNRLSLSGKPMPLVITKSHFSKPSGHHVQRLAALTNAHDQVT